MYLTVWVTNTISLFKWADKEKYDSVTGENNRE
jgi:hypothetical protein